jgi:hypothetical protein
MSPFVSQPDYWKSKFSTFEWMGWFQIYAIAFDLLEWYSNIRWHGGNVEISGTLFSRFFFLLNILYCISLNW